MMGSGNWSKRVLLDFCKQQVEFVTNRAARTLSLEILNGIEAENT